MASEQIKEFLREKTEKARAMSAGIDWAAKRDAWIGAVEQLYDRIEHDYLGPADIAAYVRVDRSRVKTIEEQHIGTYSIAELNLRVGDEQVLFSPKGVNTVGAQGRVDVRGERGEANLVRQADDTWSLVVARSPRLQLAPLDEECFLAMLRGVMH